MYIIYDLKIHWLRTTSDFSQFCVWHGWLFSWLPSCSTLSLRVGWAKGLAGLAVLSGLSISWKWARAGLAHRAKTVSAQMYKAHQVSVWDILACVSLTKARFNADEGKGSTSTVNLGVPQCYTSWRNWGLRLSHKRGNSTVIHTTTGQRRLVAFQWIISGTSFSNQGSPVLMIRAQQNTRQERTYDLTALPTETIKFRETHFCTSFMEGLGVCVPSYRNTSSCSEQLNV